MLLTKKSGAASAATLSPFVHSLRRGLSNALPTVDRRAFLRRSGLGLGVGHAGVGVFDLDGVGDRQVEDLHRKVAIHLFLNDWVVTPYDQLQQFSSPVAGDNFEILEDKTRSNQYAFAAASIGGQNSLPIPVGAEVCTRESCLTNL